MSELSDAECDAIALPILRDYAPDLGESDVGDFERALIRAAIAATAPKPVAWWLHPRDNERIMAMARAFDRHTPAPVDVADMIAVEEAHIEAVKAVTDTEIYLSGYALGLLSRCRRLAAEKAELQRRLDGILMEANSAKQDDSDASAL